MHLHHLDPYQFRQSLVHGLDARVKLVGVVSFILTLSLMPMGAWQAYTLMLAVAVSLILLSELGIKSILARALLALPFVLAALPILFTTKGTPVFNSTWSPTWQGAERFASIAFKSWVSLQMSLVLAQSTRFPELLQAMRALHVPALFVNVFGLMWRYLFVLADEAQSLLQARASRSGLSTNTNANTLLWRARVAGGMAGNLFLRASERGERIYQAMCARGYDGEVRGFGVARVPSNQTLGLFLFLFLLIGLWGVARLF